VVRRVVLGPTVQRQPRIATQVERLERTGHPAQVEVAVGGEVHFSPAAAGRLVPSQGRQGGELADGKGTPYLIGELWSAATTSCHEDVGIRRFMASEDGLTVRQVGGDRRRCAAAGGSSDRERPGRRAGGHYARAEGTPAAHRRGVGGLGPAGGLFGRRSRTWSTATRFRGPAGSPPPSAFALIIAGAARPAATTPPLGRLPWPRRYHNGLLDLVELDVLHDDLDQPEKPSP